MVISTASNRRFIRVFGVAAIFLLTIGFFSFRNITEGELIPKVQSDDVDESVYQAEYPILGEYGTDKSGEISKPKAPIFPVHDELFQQSNLIPLSIRTYGDPFKYIKASDITEDDLTEAKMCPKLKYEAKIEVSRQKFLDVPFQKIESALSKYPDINHLVEKAYGFHKSKFPKETQWLRFAGSSVWLNEYEVHLMVLRIYNSPSGIPNKGYVSFLYVQLYDRNWNELPPTTLSVPYQQDTLRTVVEPDGTIRHEVIDTELSYRDVEYPSILPIPFDRELQSDGDWYYGPEDPRMILRRNPMGFDEPLIVFNMKSLRLLERVMHLYLPFSTHFTVLQRRDTPFTHVEKNWTPFMSAGRNEPTDSVDIIYSLDPLEILKCNIKTGICDYTQKPKVGRGIGPLRCGTQLMEFPEVPGLTLPENRKAFLGFARAHIGGCGCGESMYRPNLMILIRDYNPDTKELYYKISHVSEYVDFYAQVKFWRIPSLDSEGKLNPPDDRPCLGRSVLIPNSVSYWEVKSIVKDGITYEYDTFQKLMTEESESTEFDRHGSGISVTDYLGLTLSSGDMDVSVVQIKGLLTYLQNVPGIFDTETIINNDKDFELKGNHLNAVCAISGSDKYCKAYADKLHANYNAKEEEKKKEANEKQRAKQEAEDKKKAEEDAKKKELADVQDKAKAEVAKAEAAKAAEAEGKDKKIDPRPVDIKK